MNSAITPPPAKKHRNLAQGVVAYVNEQTRQGTLKVGDKLPTESAFMELLGVSRTVVREAISHLQAAGLVETRHGIGTFVCAPPRTGVVLGLDPATVVTVHDLLAILELRISIETEAAGLASSRRTPEQLAELRAALDTFIATARAGQETVAADIRFHMLIAQFSGNRYFHDILDHLGTNLIPRARIDPVRLTEDDPVRYLARMANEHEDIYHAIARGEPETARAAMRTHLSNSRERLRQVHERHQAQQKTESA